MAFIRKLPDTPERLEHLKGGAGHLERYALLSPEEMLGAGTVCARMVLQPGCEVGEHTHHGNYEVYYFLSGHGVYRSNGETTTVDAGTVTFTGDGESHFLRNDGPEPLEFMAFVLNLPAQASTTEMNSLPFHGKAFLMCVSLRTDPLCTTGRAGKASPA